jgi:phosphoglycolate phosphatase
MNIKTKKKYNILIFDLDGTISKSKFSITKGAQFALAYLGINIDNLDELDCFIGPPLIETFQNKYHFNREKALIGVEKYREYYLKKGYKEQFAFEGIDKIIKHHSRIEDILVVATSKPTEYANDILRMYNLKRFFSLIVGSNLDNTRTSKIEVLDHALSLLQKHSKDTMVMIGDRKHDINAATKLGIDSIGVLYGYGSEDEIKDSRPTHIVKTINDLANLLEAKKGE